VAGIHVSGLEEDGGVMVRASLDREAGDQPRQRRQLFVAVVTVLGARSKGCERGDQERDALAREVVDRLKRVLIPGIRVLIPCRVENVQVQALVTILIAFHNFGDTTILYLLIGDSQQGTTLLLKN
jgi:hypothetical protein